ncbi:hypothetical protein GCM10023321_37540 [Pseudonocardia eucalypti]|uniref:Uncharacterized protein n=1 Tax=Pseudonocardia eucalypti TaxID=648755 RepID=A0ABP9QAH6_9PSEU|nr:hypothetical protein [Pseudonocardia eucalypti]
MGTKIVNGAAVRHATQRARRQRQAPYGELAWHDLVAYYLARWRTYRHQRRARAAR